jgi:hypothetical protein
VGAGVIDQYCWWDGGQVSQTLDAVLSKGQTMPEKNRFPAVLVPRPAVDDWKRVSFAADCGVDEEGELLDECSICGLDYSECACPGPTQEGYEYMERDGVMYARLIDGPALIGGFDYENNAHGPDDATGTLLKGSPSGGGRPLPAVAFAQNQIGEVRVGDIAGTVNTNSNASGRNTPMVAFGGDIARTLSARHDSSPCADRGMDVVAVQTCHRCGGGEDVKLDPSRDYLKCPECGRRVYEVQSYRTTGNCGAWATGDKTDALTTATDPNAHVLATQTAVRRLTPEECETLQGFPQGHTRIKWRNNPADDCPDGPRYKAIGNSMAVPCMYFIGAMIAAETAQQELAI